MTWDYAYRIGFSRKGKRIRRFGRKEMKKLLERKWFARFLFLCYLGAMIYFLFFSERYGRTVTYTELHYNLKPFREITRYFVHSESFSTELFLVNIIGNVAAFVPFGFLLPLTMERRKHPVIMVLCVTYLLVLTMECIQLFTMVGSFDVDDIIMNCTGSLLGVIWYRILFRKKKG